MGKPLIAITAVRMTEAWHQLSKEEQDSLMAKVRARAEQFSGVKSIVICRAVGAPWDFYVVDEYSDIEAIQKLEDLDAELNWKRYWEGMSLLGTRWEAS